MTESETAPLLGNHEEPSEVGEEKGWRERAAAALKSRPFHSFIFSLIIIDCLIVIVELAFVLLSSSCGGDEDFPAWLQALLHLSAGIAVLFVLEIPPSVWAFGIDYYNPWSDVPHSTFHLLDATIILINFTVLFLQGPAQELAGLLVLLRLWRLVKLLGGVASGAEGLNERLHRKLDRVEKELSVKTDELAKAQRTIADLQHRLDTFES